jgi:hypothetical protein
MAGVFTTLSTGEMALAGVTGGAAKTMALVQAPTNQRLKIRAIKVSLKGTNPNAIPVFSELIVGQSGLGSMNPQSVVKNNIFDPETPQAAGYVNANTAVTEPPGGNRILSDETPAAGGVWEERNLDIAVPGGARMGIRLTNSDSAISGVVDIVIEE